MVAPLAGNLIGEVIGDALGDVRNQIADPNRTDPLNQARRAMCDAYASTPGPLSALAGLGAQATMGYMCRPYWEGQGTDPPVTTEPFTGGQCENVRYSVTVNLNWVSGVENGSNVQEETDGSGLAAGTNFYGPISNIRLVQGDATFGGFDGTVYSYVELTDIDGVKVVPSNLNGRMTAITNIDVVRFDGEPDTCGDPDPTPQPGPNNPNTPWSQPQVRNVGGDNYNFTPNITTDLSNNPVVRMDITNNNGDLVFPPFVISPTFNPPNLPEVPQPPSIDGDSDTLPGGGGFNDVLPDEALAEKGYEVIGFKWAFPNVPANRGGIVGANPRILPNTFGNFRLKYADDSGNICWSKETEIKSIVGSMFRPDKALKVVGYAVNSIPVFNEVVVTPVYGVGE